MAAKKPRNYSKEYEEFQGTPEQIKNRSSRNKARRKLTKLKGKKAVAGKDVGHKNNNPLDNSTGNLKLETPSKNRARKK